MFISVVEAETFLIVATGATPSVPGGELVGTDLQRGAGEQRTIRTTGEVELDIVGGQSGAGEESCNGD
jgi:hypothetical protein